MQSFEFKTFPLTRSNTDAWESLLDLNGGRSASWITGAPGKDHSLYVCCLILTTEPKRKKPENENLIAEMMFSEEEWAAYYSRIAIVVPVAVQNGIAMAQGIKRLYDTCPCEHLKRLGITLLAHTARHFDIEYIFLSPIQPFVRHIRRELYVCGVPFGDAGYRSLCWALREHFADRRDQAWVDIRFEKVFYTRKDKFYRKEAVVLTIAPQPCAKEFKEQNYLTGETLQYSRTEYTTECRQPPKRRVLLLNEGFYITESEDTDPDYRPPSPLPLETHDFLWFIAGDGVLVVHGPSLATLIH